MAAMPFILNGKIVSISFEKVVCSSESHFNVVLEVVIAYAVCSTFTYLKRDLFIGAQCSY